MAHLKVIGLLYTVLDECTKILQTISNSLSDDTAQDLKLQRVLRDTQILHILHVNEMTVLGRCRRVCMCVYSICIYKGEVIPLQARCGPGG